MSKNKKEDARSISVSGDSQDPMAEKLNAYSDALESLPKGLRTPIAEYVKQHVEMELSPAPVTKSQYWAHVLICAACFLLFLVVYEFKRFATINDDDFTISLAWAGITLVSVWFASLFFSVILRIQTRKFKISSVIIACSLAFIAFFLGDEFSKIIYFYVRPDWVALFLSQMFFASGTIYWVHWLVRNALPSSRAQMVRYVSLSLVLLVGGGLFALSYKNFQWNDDDLIPAIHVIPFAGQTGANVNLALAIQESFSEAGKRAEVFADVHSDRGYRYYSHGKYKQAVEAYSTAIKLDPKKSNYYSRRGDAYFELGEYDRAIADFDEEMRLEKNKSHRAAERADALYLKGENALAIAAYDELISKRPKVAEYKIRRGVIYLYLKKQDMALADFSSAMESDPRSAEALLWMKVAGQKMGKDTKRDEHKSKVELHRWPGPLLAVLSGEAKAGRLPATLKNEKFNCEQCRKCQLKFFSGQWALQARKWNEAKSYFQAADKHCKRRGKEWQAARLELKALEKAETTRAKGAG